MSFSVLKQAARVNAASPLLSRQNLNAFIRQTLIKLERWLDAVEFCDRALHVDGKCVKALSRRASAFVKLAGEHPVSLAGVNNTNAIAVKPTTASSTGGCSVGVASLTAAGDANANANANKSEKASAGGEGCAGGEGQEEEKIDRCERFGGRDGLMALALLDLDAAVEADPEGEDVRRQRDSLSQEIEEEKVRNSQPQQLQGGINRYEM